MLNVQYIDLSLDIYPKKDIKDYYPCGEVNSTIGELPTTDIRIFDCEDGKKYLDMWISEDNNASLNRVRMLLNTLKVFDEVGTKDPITGKYDEDTLIGYPYKSINYIYLVLNVSEYTKNVLYYFNGCSSDDELTLNESDPYIYRNGILSDKVFEYYNSAAELASTIGEFKSMVPVFLKNTIRTEEEDGQFTIKKQTIAPYTMASYVFLSTGDTVEDICSQISKFHKMNTQIEIKEDSTKIEFTPPIADFFDYYGSLNPDGTIKSEYMDVYIGSTYIAPERYIISKEVNSGKTHYYLSFIEDTNGKLYTVNAGRHVYINYYYNSYPNVKSPIMTLIDGEDIIKYSIPTDRLENVTTDASTDDQNTLVTAASLSKLREEFITNLSKFTGNNVLHANAMSTSTSINNVNPEFIYVINAENAILNQRTGSTIFMKLDRDMISGAKICIRNAYIDSTETTKWGDDILFPIYSYDDQPFTTYTDASGSVSTDITGDSDYPVPSYELKADQIVQLVYNTIKGEPRFYINTGERYRLVETHATCTYHPEISQSSYSNGDIYIYLSDPGVSAMVMEPYVTYIPGVDLITLKKNGVELTLNEDYIYEPENKRIKIFDIDNIETATFNLTITSVRSII